MEITRFDELSLSAPMLEALEQIKYTKPSPIQAALLPIALKGIDVAGQAHTGTGKTAAFVIPILECIDYDNPNPQALILTPTRELSEQVSREAIRLSSNRHCGTSCLVGGRPIKRQMDGLKKNSQIVVGTPGRVIDLMNRRALKLEGLKVVVLDEADRMLDIGFRPDIERILRRCPTKRQTMLLSATMPPPVERLARQYMISPQKIDLSGDDVVVGTIEQFYVTVDPDRKTELLARLLIQERPGQAIVFTRTKRRADLLYKSFSKRLPNVDSLHGDLPQYKRDRTMQAFRDGKVRLLIATDIVGRGIDVSGISHIINYDIPEYHDDYVHRIGRTGRMTSAGKGIAVTFVTREQGGELTRIELRINMQLQEYKLDGFQAFRPRKPTAHVDPKSRTRAFHVA